MKNIYLAGGCFWGTQHFFSLVKGVINTKVGYANGIKENPTYKEVCSKKYNFVEAVEIEYDEAITDLNILLKKFFLTINPTSLNKQGGDIGLQYRTGIYFTEDNSREIATKALQQLQAQNEKKIQIELLPLENFYSAEAYHQDYLDKNPNGYCYIPFSLFEKAKE